MRFTHIGGKLVKGAAKCAEVVESSNRYIFFPFNKLDLLNESVLLEHVQLLRVTVKHKPVR